MQPSDQEPTSEQAQSAEALPPTLSSAVKSKPDDPMDQVKDGDQPEADSPDKSQDADQTSSPEEAENGSTKPKEASVPELPPYSWEASEFVHHQKGPAWNIGLAALVLVAVAIGYFTHEWLMIMVFIMAGVALFVFAHKEPRALMYQLDQDGLTIDGKLYPYESFRSFAVAQDEEWHSIELTPTQRFMPGTSVVFDPEDLDSVRAHLLQHLPEVSHKPGLIDQFARKVRF